jgi:hypothetical protein
MSSVVAQTFSLQKFQGTYYELYYHDYTQYPTCPKPSCVHTTKTYYPERKQVVGNWSLECLGTGPYPVQLVFNLTAQTGVFAEYNKEGFNVPNVIVDFKESNTSTAQYDWVIEFQCSEKKSLDHPNGHVDFVGINWYSKEPVLSKDKLDLMLQRARDRGLGPYMDSGLKVRTMPQANCTYSK